MAVKMTLIPVQNAALTSRLILHVPVQHGQCDLALLKVRA